MATVSRPPEDDLPADPLLGRVIDGRYTVLSMLGQGGMGSVYRAWQASLSRNVALKVLIGAPDPNREAEFQRRFFLEASTVARLQHPNTITVFDYGSEEIGPTRYFFIAMELLDGETLSRLLKREAPLQPQRAVHIALQMCRSLREAHRAGVVHRDLKPGNIMLLKQGDEDEPDRDFVKVLDFGLAKTFHEDGEEALTRVGTFLGSPRYVSPEQIEGRAIDPRADIYSLGCVLYRMLTSRVPFDGNAPMEIMLKHLRESVPPLDMPTVPDVLDGLVRQCLEKKADKRPSSMEEVIQRLKLSRAQLSGGMGFYSLSDGDGHGASEGEELYADDVEPRAGPTPHLSNPDAPPELMSTPILLNKPRETPVMEHLDIEPSGPHPTVPPTRIATPRPNPARAAWPSQDVSPALAPVAMPFDMRGSFLDETRPTQQLRPARRRSRSFLIGALIGVASAFAIVLFLQSERGRAWLDRVSNPTSSVRGPSGVDASGHVPVQVEVKSDPPSSVSEKTPNGSRALGITPLVLDWNLVPGGAARRLVFVRPGHGAAEADVQLPLDVARRPGALTLKIDVELTPSR